MTVAAIDTAAPERELTDGFNLVIDALKLNEPEIENDPALPTLADLVFGAAIPSDMPALIKYVKAQGGLKDVVFDPSAGV